MVRNALSPSASQPRGLFAEMEQVESRERTYPVTEGFCCLIQELVQHDLPYNLGEKTRYRGASGIQPYVAYLLKCVLIPELRFADAGERWRVAARVLQVMLTLLRRYPLAGEGGGVNPGPSSMATPEDEEACRLDFDPRAPSSSSSSSQVRLTVMSFSAALEGGLFRQMVQVLKGPGRHGDGGVAGLKAARVKAAASTALKQGLMLLGGRKNEADGGSLASADRFGVGAGAGSGLGGPQQAGLATTPPPAAEPKLDPVEQGGPGPDWSWWRERCVLLSLSMLEAASEREKAFVDQWRARVSAGGLDDYDEDGGRGGRGRGGAGGGGTLAPPAYLGNLLSEQNTIAVVARYIEYDGNMVIPLLSTSVLLSCGRNLPAGNMMATLMASDPRECNALAEAYTYCLAADGLSLGGNNLPSLEEMLCPPNREADGDFMTLDTALIGAGTGERNWGGDEGAVG
ncbi:unnamed protein product [Ectocarpus sp. CCAP 1310/34]|nr:unnamed protein product [Ectocarpus sp. CCAP 1310/34]